MSRTGRRSGPRRPPPAGTDARRVAIDALVRIDRDDAYANLVLGEILARSELADRDRRYVTELVYGTTRMRRAVDHLIAPYLLVDDPDPDVRAALRIGAYQLAFLDTPAHAAVGATVGAVRKKVRPVVNAVLRRVAAAPLTWPDDPGIRLSYPDWVVERLVADLGPDDALDALTIMNEPATVTERDDGYVQDRASQWVAELVDAGPGLVVADLCAAPGGKATALAATGARVVAADVRPGRVGLVRDNARRLGTPMAIVAADARRPPLRAGSLDRVLLDAPCSGLGALRRRPDARWRVTADAVDRLAALQVELVDAAVALLAPGGVLVYSVCTLTRAESVAIDDHLAHRHPTLEPLDRPGEPWQAWGRGAMLLPQAAGTDGMYVLRLRRPASAGT
ncbi:MAG: transcription antitermination factor NusB [Actinomycetota bacterium]|nr:transcription antitermination factor NusB [Actinomycetota bacterium]